MRKVTRCLVCILFVGLFGCSNEIAITPVTKAQTKPTANISNSPTVKPTTEPVKVVGEFTNVESNGEHQWGYSVQIWKQGDNIFGLISGDSASRLIGDPPTGILENISFHAKTGKLSFRAILPYLTYEFDGILTKKKLTGKLLNTTHNKIEKITLPRSKEWSSEMDEYQSYEEWKVYADSILKFRGPKQS